MSIDIEQLTSDDILGLSNASPNPFFKYLTGFIPRKLKDLFKVVEYLYFQSAPIFSALTKLSEYSVTDLQLSTDNAGLRIRTKELLEKTLNIKQVLKACSRDRMVYGNSFVSIYMPFTRFLQCDGCKEKRNITKIDYKFKWKDMSFRWNCPACKKSNVTSIDNINDVKSLNPNKISIIRWDPKLMDIEYNPLTGQSIYYYTPPRDLKSKIQAGNKHILNSAPRGFLKTIKDSKIFKFEDDQIFHMKVDAPAGVDAQWGMPPLMAAIDSFYYAAVLRKANEAIALDHIVPFRVLHPRQTNDANNPARMINMNNWMEQTKENLRRWRRDPNHIMFSPVALDSTQMGGDGKTLLTLAEVEAAENNIMAAMGIPREFLYGGLSFTGSSVTLRMLENQLISQTKGLEDLMNWICRKAAAFLGWPAVPVTLTPFKLLDDPAQRGLILNLNQGGQQILSNTTIATVFGYDLDKERRLRQQETLDEARFNAELQVKLQAMQNTVADQARAKSQQGQASLTYDTQQVTAAADQLVQQFMQLDPGTRRSQLESLKSEDLVMYSVVRERMAEMQKQQATQVRQQVKAQVGQDGMGGGGAA